MHNLLTKILNNVEVVPLDFSTVKSKKEVWDSIGKTIGAGKYAKIGIDNADTLVYSSEGQSLCGGAALQCLGYSEEAATIAMKAIEDLQAM